MKRCVAVRVLCVAALSLQALPLAAQQVVDTAFHPVVAHPAFAVGRGPVVVIDEGHNNFHTVDGRYAPFAELLRRDGYVVRGHPGPVTRASLAGVRVLVIANPMHRSNLGGNWRLPTPSAFSAEEIQALRAWVEAGGSLLLIADHMPFGGAAADLGAAFGFTLTNGFVFDGAGAGIFTLRRADGGVADHEITMGIDSVETFMGQAFRGDARARPLLVLGPGMVSREPEVAWQFDSTTVTRPVTGWWQAAVRPTGRGRVAVFGEAAMFSAQRAGAAGFPVGMNAPGAVQNATLLRNVLHWLAP